MYILDTTIKTYNLDITETGCTISAYKPLNNLYIRDIWRPGWRLWKDGSRIDPFEAFPSSVQENVKARKKNKRKQESSSTGGLF